MNAFVTKGEKENNAKFRLLTVLQVNPLAAVKTAASVLKTLKNVCVCQAISDKNVRKTDSTVRITKSPVGALCVARVWSPASVAA